MNIQLKKSKTFEDNYGVKHSKLFGGIKEMVLSMEQGAINITVKLYISSDAMQKGKSSIHQLNVTIFGKDLMAFIGEIQELEEKIYSKLLSMKEFQNFELVKK